MSFSNFNTTPANNPLDKSIANPISILRVPKAPSSQDNTFPIGQEWQDTTTNNIWKCFATSFSGATWKEFAFATGNEVVSLSDNTGTKTFANSSGNIGVVGDGTLLTTVAGTNVITVTPSSAIPIKFNADTGSATPVSNTLVIAGSSSTGTSTSASGGTVTVASTFATFAASTLSFKVPGTSTTFLNCTSAGLVTFPTAEGSSPNNGVIIGSDVTILPENFLKIGDNETGTTAVLDITTVATASLQLTSSSGDAQIGVNAFGVNGYTLLSQRSSGNFIIVAPGPTTAFSMTSSGVVSLPVQVISPLISVGVSGDPTITSGAGAPSAHLPKGSLYLNKSGSGVNDRAYIATDAVGTWTAIVTVA